MLFVYVTRGPSGSFGLPLAMAIADNIKQPCLAVEVDRSLTVAVTPIPKNVAAPTAMLHLQSLVSPLGLLALLQLYGPATAAHAPKDCHPDSVVIRCPSSGVAWTRDAIASAGTDSHKAGHYPAVRSDCRQFRGVLMDTDYFVATNIPSDKSDAYHADAGGFVAYNDDGSIEFRFCWISILSDTLTDCACAYS